MKTEHWCGEKDESGARAWRRTNCTIRVAQAFAWWQPKKGGRWRPTHHELTPDCAGGALPMSLPVVKVSP